MRIFDKLASRIVWLIVAALGVPCFAEAPARPLMRDFMGLNVHTVQFKPAVYAPVCRLLRDYHPVAWDVAEDPSHATHFPLAANGVDWNELYGSWAKAGYEIDVCLMFDGIKPSAWADPATEARAYGEAFARSLGPSGSRPIVRSVEIGNEPSQYSEAQYRAIFAAMAAGVRAGDPKLLIATCAVMTGKTDQWSKPLSSVAGLEDAYDVLNLHAYAFKDKWPTWRRSYPEDESIEFLKQVRSMIDYRDHNVPNKALWLTEFGFDSSTRLPAADGPWAKWVGLDDETQARYIVRTFLTLSELNLQRAYLYFFNDNDEPQLHGASGLTRKFEPKPSFWAMAQLYRVLGNYRFSRALLHDEQKLNCFEFRAVDQTVWVAWLATDTAEERTVALPILPGANHHLRAQRMSSAAGEPTAAEAKVVEGGVEVKVSGAPVYLFAQ